MSTGQVLGFTLGSGDAFQRLKQFQEVVCLGPESFPPESHRDVQCKLMGIIHIEFFVLGHLPLSVDIVSHEVRGCMDSLL